MSIKTGFHTYDIFNIEDETVRQKYFSFCHEKAICCGLECACHTKAPMQKLELWGTKSQLIKYYILTLTKCQYKLKGIKRIASFIFD